jgi:Chromosome segregation ATPases
MDGQIVNAVTEWDTASFGGGYDGLNDLADAEFSGAIKTASTWAFMLNGNVIGVVDGSLSAFDGGDGTAYEAPDPSLPLLYTMQTGDSEKQAEYYTNDTAISEADDTLSSGNFTGYIKLSENVHSGDYYIVYYGGRSMSVAFVGNSRQLFTGDEAFERANDEIGIYRVYAADIDVVDIPETERNTAAAADTGISIDNTPDTDSGAADDGSATTPVPDDDGSTATTGGQPTDASETATNGGGASESTGGEPDATTAAGGAADDSTATASTESTTPDRPSAPPSEPAETPQSTGDTAGGRAANGGSGETQTAGGSATAEASGNANRFSEESEWQNTTTIPSLDPDEEATSSRGQTGDGQQLTQRSPQSSGADSDGQLSRKQLRNRLEDAEAVMEKAEKRHKELIEARDTARQERNEAREERDAAQEQIDELETKLAEAETEIEQLESQLAEAEERLRRPPKPSRRRRRLPRPMSIRGTRSIPCRRWRAPASLSDTIPKEQQPSIPPTRAGLLRTSSRRISGSIAIPPLRPRDSPSTAIHSMSSSRTASRSPSPTGSFATSSTIFRGPAPRVGCDESTMRSRRSTGSNCAGPSSSEPTRMTSQSSFPTT